MTDETKARMSISSTTGNRTRADERTRGRITANASASGVRQQFATREATDSSRVAPFARRCGALLIDYILAAAILAVTTMLSRTAAAGIGARTDSVVEGFGLLLAAAMLVFNFVILAGLTNRTFGKWATGLRIERTNGDAVSFSRIFLRHLIGYPLSLITLGIGFLIPVFNRDGRALHDFLFDTIVVRDSVETRHSARPPRRRISNQGRMPQR
ncbi:MAG: RDD family protein [Pyrinomonadaceae bacterium MAG19_C2-C3]|nr:RDD family protein [Pyrinomonadaceae bacterium MAG19_C2-C3]